MTPNRIVAAIVGTLSGILGGTGIAVAAAIGGGEALVFGLFGTNLLLGAVQLALAVALVSGFLRGDAAARVVNIAAGTVLLLLGLFGLFTVGTPANVLALNGADNVLHFAGSVALLATGLGAPRGERPPS
ncbi:DUF4383 domain-containing protein [Protaetiibacter intestinalis]|uniref:DUF4383 domain-containing protein n=1 Tax=Protaetiibacter intestinalis TaxID=2419774 RepID=A0A387B2Z2_9MICO|nr:DUF4383 domain-containing protein [Protaetiibacter intestinalis]AYF97912.1 DUF4383 domain-containing protein [Protaetiibacter intestinalis]